MKIIGVNISEEKRKQELGREEEQEEERLLYICDAILCFIWKESLLSQNKFDLLLCWTKVTGTNRKAVFHSED